MSLSKDLCPSMNIICISNISLIVYIFQLLLYVLTFLMFQVEGGLGGVHDAVTRKPTDDILLLMEMRHFVVNLVRLCKQTYDLCLLFDLARLYVCFSFCNDYLSWIKMIELDVLLNVGLNEDLRDTFI